MEEDITPLRRAELELSEELKKTVDPPKITRRNLGITSRPPCARHKEMMFARRDRVRSDDDSLMWDP